MKLRKKTKDVIKLTANQLTDDIKVLSSQKAEALSTFRETAEKLNVINEELKVKAENLEELAKFICEQQKYADKMFNDNEKIRNKILDIIGE